MSVLAPPKIRKHAATRNWRSMIVRKLSAFAYYERSTRGAAAQGDIVADMPLFSKLFGSSPISPIREHMKTCEGSVLALVPFFDAVGKDDWDSADTLYETISDLEGEADQLKRKVRRHLPRSLFLPLPRTHLLEIIQVQDQIANDAKDIAGIMLGRKMAFPPEANEQLNEFLQASIDTVAIARKVIDDLNGLVKTGFSTQTVERIEKMLEDLHTAEHRSDILQIQLRRTLYEYETDLNPVHVIFLYRVIDKIGDIADDAQTVGNRMMYLIAS